MFNSSISYINMRNLKFLFSRLIFEYKFPQYELVRVFKKLIRLTIFKKKKAKKKKIIAICDLNYVPFTYNFGQFLLLLSKQISINNYYDIKLLFIWPSKEKIDFLKKNYPLETLPPVNIDEKEMKWRFDNLIFPMINLFPINFDSIEIIYNNREKFINYDDCDIFPKNYTNQTPRGFNEKELFKLSDKEIEVNGQRTGLKSNKLVKDFFCLFKIDPNKTITITLRNYGFDKSRNSNIEVWEKFALYLKQKKINVIFVPDTENLWENKFLSKNFYYLPEFSINLNLRFSLYESVKFNFFTSSGPGGQSTYSAKKINYAMYRCQVKDNSIINTEENLKVMGKKKQPNFISSNQYYIHEDESFESLVSLYEEKIATLF